MAHSSATEAIRCVSFVVCRKHSEQSKPGRRDTTHRDTRTSPLACRRSPKEVPMSMIGAFDVHRAHIMFDWVDHDTGETRARADRAGYPMGAAVVVAGRCPPDRARSQWKAAPALRVYGRAAETTYLRGPKGRASDPTAPTPAICAGYRSSVAPAAKILSCPTAPASASRSTLSLLAGPIRSPVGALLARSATPRDAGADHTRHQTTSATDHQLQTLRSAAPQNPTSQTTTA